MTDALTTQEISELSAYELARMAECSEPDRSTSPGAEMLDGVRDSVLRAIDEGRIKLEDFNDDGQLSEIANDAPSVYTATMWAQFVDLGAWAEEPELGEWPKDLGKAAMIALYQIAERLGHRLCEAWAEEWVCPVCTGEPDEYGCDNGECANPAGALAGLAAERRADLAADPFRGHPDYAGEGWQRDYEALPKAPVSVVEPLPIRTPGVALAQSIHAASDVLAGRVSVSIAEAEELLNRSAQTAGEIRARVNRGMHERRLSRFRRRVWIVTAVLMVIGVTVAFLTV